MISALIFPGFDPVLVQIGPLAIRWYALAYIVGLVVGWRMLRGLVTRSPAVVTPLQADDYLTWATLGVVLGGRMGYVLFYQPARFLVDPLAIFAVWEGGMSFHGGLAGVVIATFWFCRRNAIPFWGFSDRVCTVAPVGLFLGRIANFINGELWGRIVTADLPWAMIFPAAGPAPRHPSQLYQAALEGLALFVLMQILARREGFRAQMGRLTGAFMAGYAIARIIGELFREPDSYLGYLALGTTMGQWLSVPMLVFGLWLLLRRR